ncbi:hypothetical protein D7D52_32895 [Nocardia yunnanensis]|uniref:Uncharacterized protein n=1 Tax=Nocardia yunnanensis TaxID=2382165 RepID=A0A386ZIT2_9NOCA|nr:hypothetical protein D7D52_32895 [Nocardia yunnanensis]
MRDIRNIRGVLDEATDRSLSGISDPAGHAVAQRILRTGVQGGDGAEQIGTSIHPHVGAPMHLARIHRSNGPVDPFMGELAKILEPTDVIRIGKARGHARLLMFRTRLIQTSRPPQFFRLHQHPPSTNL